MTAECRRIDDHEICRLKEKVSILEERLESTAKALQLAEKLGEQALEIKGRNNQMSWTHIALIVTTIISITALIIQFYKKGG